jgi:hypothetical protein
MKIFGFWHIAAAGARDNWAQIYPEQWTKLQTSGLYAATDRLHVTVCGPCDAAALRVEAGEAGEREPWRVGDGVVGRALRDDPKVVLASYADREVFEFPALAWLRHLAETEREPFRAYYLHTKGASTADREGRNPAYWWGEYMAHYVVFRWRDCVLKLAEGFDTCGVEWRREPEAHYSGNFWWATSAYVRRLPDVPSYWRVNPHDRIRAEMWLGQAGPRAASLKNLDRDLYHFAATPELWT